MPENRVLQSRRSPRGVFGGDGFHQPQGLSAHFVQQQKQGWVRHGPFLEKVARLRLSYVVAGSPTRRAPERS